MEEIVDAAENVLEEMGSGWSESIYHRCLELELSRQGIEFSSEGTISVQYRGKPVGRRRPDMFVTVDDGVVVLELKAGSSRGGGQLVEYMDLLDADDNFDDLAGGILLQFNDDLEYETEELK